MRAGGGHCEATTQANTDYIGTFGEQRIVSGKCSFASVSLARNTDAPRVALMDLIASNQLRKQAAQEGCLTKEIEAAWSSRSRSTALGELIASNKVRQLASQEGCLTQEIEAAWSSRNRDAAMTELIASNRLRQQAAQEGCLTQEIEAAWSNAAAGRGAAGRSLDGQ